MVDNLPYSSISTFVPSWVMFNSIASNSFPEISGLIFTKTFAEVYVLAIETIVLVVFVGISTLSVSINTTPPRLVLPVPVTASPMLYPRVIIS